MKYVHRTVCTTYFQPEKRALFQIFFRIQFRFRIRIRIRIRIQIRIRNVYFSSGSDPVPAKSFRSFRIRFRFRIRIRNTDILYTVSVYYSLQYILHVDIKKFSLSCLLFRACNHKLGIHILFFFSFLIFFWRARVCRPLLRLCRPFMIFDF